MKHPRAAMTCLSGMSLDVRLGTRMLVTYPGLTLVGGLAMAFGIWFGAVSFEMFGVVTSTKLPLPDGDRIVRIQNWDAMAQQGEDRVVYDYQFWRAARSITDAGAYRDALVNLTAPQGSGQPALAAEVTAAAFRIAPARPLMGRVLDESDEAGAAPPVVVLGYDIWQQRFAGDAGIVGQDVRLGSSYATVVGVMPEGYAFPVSHELWLPLRLDLVGTGPRSGAYIKVFGRLAEGVSRAAAQAEFSALGTRFAAELPATHEHIRPHVLPYTQSSVANAEIAGVRWLAYFFITVLMVVVSSTVALLLFARAAAREPEMIVRSALGASRGRIIAQLFAEALVLAGLAAALGLVAAQLSVSRWGAHYFEVNIGRLPFWFDFNVSPTTVIAALGLALVGAVVAGVMPARKITRGLGTRLRAGTAGGGGVNFGGVWTIVIVMQVALTVTLPAVVMLVRNETMRIASYDPGFPMHEYLGIGLDIDKPLDEELTPDAFALLDARFSSALETLRQRLLGEPGVAAVTFVDRLPGDYHIDRRVELMTLPGQPSAWVKSAAVDDGYFAALQAPVIAGRGFTSADLAPDAHVVMVDQGFVDLVMGGRSPLGHQVRISTRQMPDSLVAQQPWHQIVGVVRNLGMSHVVQRDAAAGLYLPTVPGSQGGLNMIVHSRGDPLAVAPRVRDIAAAVDPALRIEKVGRLDQATSPLLWFLGLWMRIIIGLTAVALLLSLSGIYAVLSYIVARRTREIGVRVALGASASRVIMTIFRRPLTQVSLGVLAGVVLIGFASVAVRQTEQFSGTGGGLAPGHLALLAAHGILMSGICMLACVVPTLRALRVQPTEALRSD